MDSTLCEAVLRQVSSLDVFISEIVDVPHCINKLQELKLGV